MARKTLIQVRRDTAANWTSANPTLSAGEPGFETNTGKVKIGDGSTAWNSLAYVNPGAVTVASDTIWDAKGDLAVGTGADTAAKLSVGSNGQVLVADSAQTTGAKWAAAGRGGSALVYRYTVAGSDKTSIDTGVDTPDAGSNDWTSGDLLEVVIYARTDEAVANGSCNITVNNDTGAHYDRVFTQTLNATVTGNNSRSQTSWSITCASANSGAGIFSQLNFDFQKFAETTAGNKTGTGIAVRPDSSAAANMLQAVYSLGWQSTAAITRLAITTTSSQKFKVGTELLIYKRLAS